MFSKPDKSPKPLKVTIAGDPGVGKTTLGGTFLKPAFIRIEDGTRAVEGDFLETPILSTYNEVMSAIKSASKNDDIGTIVIDSISTLEMRLEQEIVDGDPKATTIHDAGGGYGRGTRAVGDLMGKIKQSCEDTGKNVVFLCHSVVKEFQSVDVAPYNILDLRLNKHTLPHFVDLMDVVGFLRLKVYDQRKGKEKVVLSTSGRELICHPMATVAAKNRFGITKALDCPPGSNPLVDFVKDYYKKGT